jgi:simple sugar transport system substrate-binding protein
MRKNSLWLLLSLVIAFSLVLTACAAPQPTPVPTAEEKPAATAVPEPTTAPEPTKAEEPTKAPEPTQVPEPTQATPEKLIFGLLMVGPYNDHGWSQAHYDAGLYVQEKVPGSEMIYIDKVNSADRPGTTPAQLAEDLVSKGATIVIFNSDDMKDSALEFAANHPEIKVIHASGDSAWKDGKDFKDLPNLANTMGRMEYGKMIAGCAAALKTQTGQIGYLGPLINDETRRLASSAYLGARYCWTDRLGKDPADLKFKVTWIGFWFNIPGVTSDPTQVADDFYNSGYDVVISGIDTTEALVEAKKLADAGKSVWAIPYDFKGACDEAPTVCLGVPYFNWGPAYVRQLQTFMDGTWAPIWEWLGPDWADINNPDTTAVGFMNGQALNADNEITLGDFISKLAGGLNLWVGPLNLQDGPDNNFLMRRKGKVKRLPPFVDRIPP